MLMEYLTVSSRRFALCLQSGMTACARQRPRVVLRGWTGISASHFLKSIWRKPNARYQLTLCIIFYCLFIDFFGLRVVSDWQNTSLTSRTIRCDNSCSVISAASESHASLSGSVQHTHMLALEIS